MLRNISSILFITLCLNSCENYKSIKSDIPEGMVWVESKSYLKGAKSKDKYAMNREMPSHNVYVDGFFIDKTEVTNNQFQKFVDETNYLTIAEREIDWEEMKKTAPPGTEKPPDSILQPGSLIFNENYLLLNNEEIAFLEKNWMDLVDMNDYMQWWEWKIGANWNNVTG